MIEEQRAVEYDEFEPFCVPQEKRPKVILPREMVVTLIC